MPSRVRWFVVVGLCLIVSVGWAQTREWVSGIVWQEPPVVDPGPGNGLPAAVPSDAKVLFDGTDLSQWANGDKWKIEEGYAIVQGGGIQTKEDFGDCQLHIEWATPEKVSGKGQGRGNSGVFLMNRYELQVLDSFDNATYFDGQAGAIYKTKPPLVNACRKPGEWQAYDVIFTAPRFNENGQLVKPAFITVLHNGVVIHNHTEILGHTSFVKPPEYEKHGARQPISLQFHGNPVRYRNIWIREIPELTAKHPEPKTPAKPADKPATSPDAK